MNSYLTSQDKRQRIDFPLNNAFEEYQLETWLEGEPLLIEWHLKNKKKMKYE